jgi:hypothetical protein
MRKLILATVLFFLIGCGNQITPIDNAYSPALAAKADSISKAYGVRTYKPNKVYIVLGESSTSYANLWKDADLTPPPIKRVYSGTKVEILMYTKHDMYMVKTFSGERGYIQGFFFDGQDDIDRSDWFK